MVVRSSILEDGSVKEGRMKGREFHEGKDAMKGPLWSVTEQAVGFLLEWVQVSYWNGFFVFLSRIFIV